MSIQRTMKGLVFSLLIVVAQFSQAENNRKNVLLIAVDDLKPLLGIYGADFMHTPNIDRLGKMGTVFMNNHCQVALCGPSRSSLMTGIYPDHANVYTMGQRLDDVRKRVPGLKTLPGYFKEKGYYSYGVGKLFDHRNTGPGQDKISWSLKSGVEWRWDSSLYEPTVNGYQNPQTKEKLSKTLKYLKKNKIAGNEKMLYFRKNSQLRPAYEVTEEIPDEAYAEGNFMAPLAIKNLRNQGRAYHKRGENFFVAVGFYKPHLPFNCPKKYFDLYDRNDFKVALNPNYPEGTSNIVEAPIIEARAFGFVPKEGEIPEETQIMLQMSYAACVSYVDAQIGKIMTVLEEENLWENTIVCLWGDHGFHLGDKSVFGKHTNYEQATRSPLILYSPEIDGNRKIEKTPTELIDVFPTLCDLAGIEKPAVLDGDSLMDVMKGKTSKDPVALSQYLRPYQGWENDSMAMGYAIRDERYRYVEWRKSNRSAQNKKVWEKQSEVVLVELYDYELDPLERVNLYTHPEYLNIVEKMQDKFDSKLSYLPPRKL